MSELRGFLVIRRPCSSCIFRKDSPLDLSKLLADVSDRHGFVGHRICHHSRKGKEACCRGFWNAFKDQFPMGQVAQRLGTVTFVSSDERVSP